MPAVINLDKRVTLQALVDEQSPSGEPSSEWVNVVAGDGKVWAAIDDLTGHEYLAAGGTQNATTTKITIRSRSVVATMRALHGADIYGIEAVLKLGADHLVLMAQKGVDHG